MSMLVVVNPKVEAKTLADFVTLAKSKPDKINFGSPGVGTTGHLGLALFMHAAGIRLTHVPYRGAAPAINDLLAGQIDGVVDNPPTVLAHIKAGKLRPLAVAAKQRLALLPDVPTAAEAGVKNFEASSWFGIMAPAGTPPDIVARLHREIVAALRKPAIAERIASSGARAVGNSPDGVRRADARRARDVGRDHQGGEHHAAVARPSRPRAQALPSPGALAWMASACTPPASSPERVSFTMRWRSSRLFPRNASDTI